MSIQIISRVLQRRWGSTYRKIVAIKLADAAYEDGTRIYPSVRTIARQTEMSERQVQRILQEFQEEGLLIVVLKGGGRNQPTRYRFDLNAIDCLPATDHTTGSDPESAEDNPDNLSLSQAKTVTGATRKGDRMSPDPSLPLRTPPSEEVPASCEAGAVAPSLSSQIWAEGRKLLLQDPSRPSPTVIGRWQKQASTDGAKQLLLTIIRRAKQTGTADPISYVTKAWNAELPTLPDPRQFDHTTWHFNHDAAVQTKAWSPTWGPPPGSKGCLMPDCFQTQKLLTALAEGKSRNLR